MSNANLVKLVSLVENKYLRTDLPDFKPGDTIIVNVNVTEVNRTRTQAFEGVVIGKTNRGVNSSFMVRKISYGEGVERTFQTHSPVIKDIKIVQRGHVRQSKLYYLRNLSGKAARIRQKLGAKSSVVVPVTGDDYASSIAESND